MSRDHRPLRPPRPPTAGTTRTRSRPAPSPPSRLVKVELRKMFDTRAGFWLLASIGIAVACSPPPRSSSSRPTRR